MPCYHPLQAFASKAKNSNGKSSIVFDKKIGSSSAAMEPIKIPCGQCIGCRLERSRQWALRCMHESSLYPRNCFITLTYNPENLPKDGSLQLRHFQLFFKRLRKKYGQKIRFFHCGEYGEKNQRPHYHACIFNFDFNDRIPYKTVNGHTLYTSKALSDLWSDPRTGSPYGFCTIGDVTFESAAYVARYITKKINGAKSITHYEKTFSQREEYGPLQCKDDYIHPETNERIKCSCKKTESWFEIKTKIKPEYITMSRRPGIGDGWYKKYSTDCYPSDYLIHREMKIKPPKFYDKLLEKTNELVFTAIKQSRKQQMKFDPLEESPQRRKVKEIVKKSHFKQLARSYENEK